MWQGFLDKKGGGASLVGRRAWSKRYFILTGHWLSYYESNDTTKPPKGRVPVKGLIAADHKHDKRHCTFTCTHNEHVEHEREIIAIAVRRNGQRTRSWQEVHIFRCRTTYSQH